MTDHKHSKGAVNARTGFLPVFAADFRSAFGEHSELARATSDLLTMRMARMMDRAGEPQDPSPVTEFSDDKAVDCLRALLEHVQCFKALYEEAMGAAASGTFRSAVDTHFGQAVFDTWLEHFEARDFDACEHLHSTKP